MRGLLNRAFLALASREMFILFALIITLSAIPMTLEQWHFLRMQEAPTPDETEDMERLVNGLAGILVAAGVLFESRQTIRAIAKHTKDETDPVQLELNEVAHHNGIGLLILGLFMEIGTLLIGLPARVVDFRPLEIY